MNLNRRSQSHPAKLEGGDPILRAVGRLGLGLAVVVPFGAAGWVLANPAQFVLSPTARLENTARSLGDAILEGLPRAAYDLICSEEKSVSGLTAESFGRFYDAYLRQGLKSAVREARQTPAPTATRNGIWNEYLDLRVGERRVGIDLRAQFRDSRFGVNAMDSLVYLAFELDPSAPFQPRAMGGTTLAYRDWIKREQPRLTALGIKGYPMPTTIDGVATTGIRFETWPEAVRSLDARAKKIAAFYLKNTVPVP